MELKSRVLLVLVLSFFHITGQTQEMLGIISSNYAGSNAALINPGALVTTKLYSDFNFFTLNAFAENNFLLYTQRRL